MGDLVGHIMSNVGGIIDSREENMKLRVLPQTPKNVIFNTETRFRNNMFIFM